MVLRMLLRLLSNNEQLVQKLSESYPVRRAAQWVVFFFHKGKDVIEDQGLNKKITPEQFKTLIQRISQNVKKQIEETQEQFKKK